MEQLGFDVNVRFKSGVSHVFHNVTEIHYNFPSDNPFPGAQLALESDVHAQGIVQDLDRIAEFEAKVATEKAADF
jgi:hypothetical protein